MAKILIIIWLIIALLFKIPAKVTIGLVLLLLFLSLPPLLTGHHGFVENLSWYIFVLLIFGFLQTIREFYKNEV